MKIKVDGRAWVDKNNLSRDQYEALKRTLTILPNEGRSYNELDENPLLLYEEDGDFIGLPRQYYLERKKEHHDIEYCVTEGDKSTWPGDLEFNGQLRATQQQAVDSILGKYASGLLGGILCASPGCGKTVMSTYIMSKLQVPTLIILHKEFLMDQWVERINQFLPDAKVGRVQQNMCDYDGKHIVVGMMHSLAKAGRYPEGFYNWPGLIIGDEVHRAAAPTWNHIPGLFPAKFRLGLSATPRRKDGTENAFFYHIGKIIYSVAEQRMVPRVRRVWSNFRFPHSSNFNPGITSWAILINILCKARSRNRLISEQISLAHKAGRKCLVLSDRLEHLRVLESMVLGECEKAPPSTGHFVGGLTREEREDVATKQVIFATRGMVSEGLDIPPLDTLFLTTPIPDVEQAVGRILRPCDGKKEPIVVDFRDEKVSLFKNSAAERDKYYNRIGAK